MRAERLTREELTKLWRERERAAAEQEPSLAAIPRFYVPKNRVVASAPSSALDGGSVQQQLQAELSKLARSRLREHMASLFLEPPDLERLWQLLREHASPPRSPTEERVNYDDFCQVAESMPPRCRRAFFCASHFLKFKPDAHGRISVLHYFQWVRRKVSLMQTRAELAMFDSTGDGSLSERELEMWIAHLIPTLPALAELREEFFPFYKVRPAHLRTRSPASRPRRRRPPCTSRAPRLGLPSSHHPLPWCSSRRCASFSFSSTLAGVAAC